MAKYISKRKDKFYFQCYISSYRSFSYVHPSAVIIGDCYIGKNVLVAPTAVCRGDTGIPIHVDDFSNIQDGATIHAR